MKKLYVLAGSLLLSSAAMAQGHELFFSEYAEGAHASGTTYPGSTGPSTGNERAIEIFNPTTSNVNLDPYSIRRYSNGSTTPSEEERLKKATGANTIISSGTFVYANGEATLLDIRNKADQFTPGTYGTAGPNTMGTSGSVAYFNGDDAMALVRWTGATAGQGTPVIVDIFGV
ncbi:MAG: hypothetical protein LPK19_14195, partial [Hymenobacteraceae bacterium]|nr:hypothetical protein [Hymenobacteraceae bacterium]MDX5397381.1 hypothetical protein [Hymenobacteraceae bacterium]MDX5513459.1 hypothetical protein [Hymenobacteraceae bacterium]